MHAQARQQLRRQQEERGVWYSQRRPRAQGRGVWSASRGGGPAAAAPDWYFLSHQCAEQDSTAVEAAQCVRNYPGFPSQATAPPLSTFRKGGRCFKLHCGPSGPVTAGGTSPACPAQSCGVHLVAVGRRAYDGRAGCNPVASPDPM